MIQTLSRPLVLSELLAILLALAPGALLAQTASPATITAPQATSPSTASLPAWEQLTTEQRELLIAPIRERWNTSPDNRSRFYGNAQRWRQLNPEQRSQARNGLRRWEQMDPEKQEQMRALYHQMRNLSPEQRDALTQQWSQMSQEQRRAWAQEHRSARAHNKAGSREKRSRNP